MLCTLMCVGECWRNYLSNSRALLRDHPKQGVCVFWASQSCGNIYSQSCYTLVDHAYKSLFFLNWSIGVVLHVKVETTTLSTRLANWTKTPSIFGQRILWRNQRSSSLRTPTLVNDYIVLSCPIKLHQYALSFFKSYYIFVSFWFVPVQHSWFKWRSVQNDMII